MESLIRYIKELFSQWFLEDTWTIFTLKLSKTIEAREQFKNDVLEIETN